jgi:acyl dehydratase
MAMIEYHVVAWNRAEEHANRIHSSEFARSVGYQGGLVPGVDVFAYMAHAVCEAWGLEWLAGGALDAHFARPVYDGDELTVRAESAADGLDVQVLHPAGYVCAAGTAKLGVERVTADGHRWPALPLPEQPLPATRQALEATPVLGTFEQTLTPESGRAQLEEVRERLSSFSERRIIHPGHMLRLADSVLSANVELPPWMHVSSRALFFAPVHWGDSVSVRARVISLFEKKGHRFVQLDVLALRGEEPVMRVDPYTAIYRPAFIDTTP